MPVGSDHAERARFVRSIKRRANKLDSAAHREECTTWWSSMTPEERWEAQRLRLLLEIAVPIAIDRAREMAPEERGAMLEWCKHVVAHDGDVFARGTKPGAKSRAFQAVADGLALLAYQPGGVTWLGLHWDAHP